MSKTMKITSEISKREQTERINYPYLGQHPKSERITLFTARGKGFTVHTGQSVSYIGDRDDGPAKEDEFTPFYGSVTITSEP